MRISKMNPVIVQNDPWVSRASGTPDFTHINTRTDDTSNKYHLHRTITVTSQWRYCIIQEDFGWELMKTTEN